MRHDEGRQRQQVGAGFGGAEGEVGVFAGGQGFVEGGHEVEEAPVQEHVARGDETEGAFFERHLGLELRGGVLVAPVGVPGLLDPVAVARGVHGEAQQDGFVGGEVGGRLFEPVAVGQAVAVEEGQHVAFGFAQGAVAGDGDARAGEMDDAGEADGERDFEALVAAAAVDEDGLDGPAVGAAEALDVLHEEGEVFGFVQSHNQDGKEVAHARGATKRLDDEATRGRCKGRGRSPRAPRALGRRVMARGRGGGYGGRPRGFGRRRRGGFGRLFR